MANDKVQGLPMPEGSFQRHLLQLAAKYLEGIPKPRRVSLEAQLFDSVVLQRLTLGASTEAAIADAKAVIAARRATFPRKARRDSEGLD